MLPSIGRIKLTSLLENSVVRLRFLPCTCIVTRSAFHLGLLMFPYFGRKLGKPNVFHTKKITSARRTVSNEAWFVFVSNPNF